MSNENQNLNPARNNESKNESISNGANKSESASREEAVLKLWQEKNIFEKSVEKSKSGKEFVFYEGPPTANGKPGVHHLEARSFKDAIPRYKTMRGYHVRRKGGWDTHGLPVELQVEKELGLTSKKEIEEYGVEKFNQKCRESVWQYRDIWEKFTNRIGYWVDTKNPYVTYHNSYIESVWNILSEVEKKKLLYKDYKVLPWCPRCGTALSSHELAQGYQDDKDLSVTAKFKVVGQDNTYFLAWTTTPWTLPGNVGLAVGEDIDYVKVQVLDNSDSEIKEKEIFILAKDILEKENILNSPYTIIEKIKGKDLVGTSYIPPFPFIDLYIKNDIDHYEKVGNKEKLKELGYGNEFKVYPASFVNTENGTGVVHIAVMYGQDDFDLGTRFNLPKIHTIDQEGNFLPWVGKYAQSYVKKIDESGKPVTDVEIITDLKIKNLFLSQRKYEHSYPHCWRCKTPLIYYARDSWYIRVSDPKIKDRMIQDNKSINWEPSHIREGRFGEWLRELKDWAISRERYWGTPLPIWEAEDGERVVIDSVETLKKYTKKSGNKYFVMRHGESHHNIKGVCNSMLGYKEEDGLTENGVKHVRESAKNLTGENITKIICSPYNRTRQTADIVAETIGFDKSKIVFDERIQEFKFGIFHGKKFKEDYLAWRKETGDTVQLAPEGGESVSQAKKRFADFFYDTDKENKNENILVVSHGICFETLKAIENGYDDEKMWNSWEMNKIKAGDFSEWKNFVPLPHNENFELDLHKPFIDSVELERDGKKFKRVKEVLDVWFDSGAMPFAQDHYPFENDLKVFQPKKGFLKSTHGYPADFICEAIDQTRGWFYTLHAVGALMGTGRAYKNVICLGHILDGEGKKMSKSLGNIVDPWEMIEKYGADTLRLWMYSVNQPGDSKNFDEKTVLDLHRKFFGLLYNVLAFYELYRDKDLELQTTNYKLSTSHNVLDAWILARLNEVTLSTTKNMDIFKLLEPVREMREFIDDLSTWYLRRSRDRLKDGDVDAKKTLYHVLKTLSKLIAPFAPFSAEDMWQKLKLESDEESVHLTSWPEAGKVDKKIIEEMQKVRDLCTEGNSLRKKLNIPLRQPLATFFIKENLTTDLIEIIKDELNVKNVSVGNEVSFDTDITPELKREGDYRELLRSIQDMRKEKGLKPSDVIKLVLATEYKETVSGFEEDLKKTAGVSEISFEDGEEKIRIN